MSTEYNAVQESIKIALDAADAATDVTSEYNKTKREHKKLEASVKRVHRFSIIIFASSMVAAVAALMFAGMIYFRTMSELSTMTTTSREALVVFAENVEGVNDALDKMKAALNTQKTLVGQNETLINELVGLRDIISRSNETMMTGMESTSSSIANSSSGGRRSRHRFGVVCQFLSSHEPTSLFRAATLRLGIADPVVLLADHFQQISILCR